MKHKAQTPHRQITQWPSPFFFCLQTPDVLGTLFPLCWVSGASILTVFTM